MSDHDLGNDDDDVLARRLRRAAAGHQPRIPDGLVARTLATVQRDRQRRGGWWRTRAWRPLLAASALAAATLVLALGPGWGPAPGPHVDLSVALSPWQSLPELPLHQEWRSLQRDADRAARVLVACLPGMHEDRTSGDR